MCSEGIGYLHGDGRMNPAVGNIYEWEGIKVSREEKIQSRKKETLLRAVLSLTPSSR